LSFSLEPWKLEGQTSALQKADRVCGADLVDRGRTPYVYWRFRVVDRHAETRTDPLHIYLDWLMLILSYDQPGPSTIVHVYEYGLGRECSIHQVTIADGKQSLERRVTIAVVRSCLMTLLGLVKSLLVAEPLVRDQVSQPQGLQLENPVSIPTHPVQLSLELQ
jgi:hypothetical protein